jgi:hypothetical protein
MTAQCRAAWVVADRTGIIGLVGDARTMASAPTTRSANPYLLNVRRDLHGFVAIAVI